MSPMILLLGTGAEGGTPNPFLVMVPYVFILFIFYFLLIRPQQKRASDHRKFLESLKKGDSVVTDSGLFGTIASIHDDAVVLKVADNVKLRFLKVKVSGKAHEATSEPPNKK